MEKKSKFKALDLKCSEEEKDKDNKEKNILKLIDKINKDNYNKITLKLKKLMKEWDSDAFMEYSKVITTAKENNIK